MQMYIGKITEVNKDKLYLIKFIIPDVYEDSQNPLTAVPLSRLSRNPIKEDEVVIIKPEPELNLFYYLPTHEDPNLVSLQFNNKNYIKIVKNSDKIKLDINCDGDITINSSGNININSGESKDILLNNHLKVQV